MLRTVPSGRARCLWIGPILLLVCPCGVFAAEPGPGDDPFVRETVDPSRQPDVVPRNARDPFRRPEAEAEQVIEFAKRLCKVTLLAKPSDRGAAGAEAVLDQPVAAQLSGVSVGEAVDVLEDVCGINVSFDRIALDEKRVREDLRVAVFAGRISVGGLLDAILLPHKLDWVVEGDGLQITKDERAREFKTTKVEGLLEMMGGFGWEAAEQGEFRMILSNNEASLSVTHHRRFHRSLAKLLEHLQAAAAGRRPPSSPIRRAFSQKVTVDFAKIPFTEAVRRLSEQTGANIVLDCGNSDEFVDGSGELVTLCMRDVSLGLALERLPGRYSDLSPVALDEFVLMTEPKEDHVQPRVYPIGHILAVRDSDGEITEEFETFEDAMSSTVAPTTWERVGGFGAVRPLFIGRLEAMVVVQTENTHREVADLIAGLAKIRQDVRAGRLAPCYCQPPKTPARQAVDRALKQKRITASFANAELIKVAGQLSRRSGVSIVVDWSALDEIGLGADTAVTAEFNREPLHSVLARIMRALELAYLVEDDYVLITTEEFVESQLPARLYPVGDLIDREDGAFVPDEEGYLAKLFAWVVQPRTWGAAGGEGDVSWMRMEKEPVLIVRQTEEAQREVLGLLTALRKIDRAAAAGKWNTVYSHYEPTPGQVAFRKLLDEQLPRKVSLNLDGMTLTAAIKQMTKLTGIPMDFDKRALDDMGIPLDTIVSKWRERPVNDADARPPLQLRDVPFEKALERVLKPLDLTWVPCSELILITTPEEAECRHEMRLYPVPDLVGTGPKLPALNAWEPMVASLMTPSGFDPIVKKIQSAVAPETWDTVGSPGAMVGISLGHAPLLVVSQTFDVHRQLEAFLEKAHAEARRNPRKPSTEKRRVRAKQHFKPIEEQQPFF